MIRLRLEILYVDNSVEIINPTIISELAAIRKTGVLAMVFWQDEGGKRIPYGYRDGKDNYAVIIDTNLFVIIFDAWNDGDRIVINAKNPQAKDRYHKLDMPLGCHNIQSANSMNFHFLGGLVNPALWNSTETLRVSMQDRERDV